MVKNTSLDWTLFGVNYLADGPEMGNYKTSLTFGGGMKKIHPGDLADFMLKELKNRQFIKKVVGIWY